MKLADITPLGVGWWVFSNMYTPAQNSTVHIGWKWLNHPPAKTRIIQKSGPSFFLKVNIVHNNYHTHTLIVFQIFIIFIAGPGIHILTLEIRIPILQWLFISTKVFIQSNKIYWWPKGRKKICPHTIELLSWATFLTLNEFSTWNNLLKHSLQSK